MKLFGTHEDISSWLPVMLMHMFEGAILGVNVYYDHKRGVLAESICAEVWFVPKRYRTCGPKLETKPLLQRDPEAPSSGDSSPAVRSLSVTQRALSVTQQLLFFHPLNFKAPMKPLWKPYWKPDSIARYCCVAGAAQRPA